MGQTDKKKKKIKKHRLAISRGEGRLSNSKILIQKDLYICNVAYI